MGFKKLGTPRNFGVFFCIAILLLLCIFFAYKWKSTAQTKPIIDNIKVDIEIPELAPAPLETFMNGVVLYDNASLWLFGRDEKMHSFSKVPANTIVEIVSYDDVLDTKISQTEKSENENIYLHVIYNSVDFWILESLVAPASTPAVIIERTRLYAEIESDNANTSASGQFGGGEISPTGTILKFGTAIALGSETKIFNEQTFEKIYYFDKNDDSVVSGFIEAGKASTKYDDIVVADIVEKLKVTTRATPRNELFLKAEKYNPSAPVKSELENQKVEKISYDYNEVLESMSKSSRYRVNLDELNTVDQSKDPFQ